MTAAMTLRDGLPPLPNRMKRLPIDHRGFPVPWFVQFFQEGTASDFGIGEPDFRVADSAKLSRAIREHRCWVCGEILGVHKAFTIGPMCAVNRVISEPPQHRDCAVFSATACPFLSQPRMRRNEKGLPDDKVEAAGLGIKRNPGVACVWVTRTFSLFRPDRGAPGILFQLGEPEEVLWFAKGRPATRAEVMESIDSGYPLLEESAREQGPKAVAALEDYLARAMPLLPAETRP